MKQGLYHAPPPPFLRFPSSLSPVVKRVLVVLAAWMTGCGRAGRVKQGPHPPSPFPSPFHLPPPPLSRCEAGDWSWPRGWLDVVVTGRGRARRGKQGRYQAYQASPPSPSPLTRCEVGDWSCWSRETRSLSCPPFPPLPRMGASDRERVGASDGATFIAVLRPEWFCRSVLVLHRNI